MARVHACRVDFSESAWNTVLDLARRERCTPAEIISRSIAIAKWADKIEEQGGKILVEKPSGCVHEVIIR